MRSKISLKVLGASLCLGAGFVFGYQSTVKAETAGIFGNMTYFTNSPYIAEKVTLTNGSGVVWVDWDNLLHVSLWYEQRYLFGDFNRDGLKDAAVLIGESQGGSDNEIELAFLINNGRRLVHRQSVYLGDSAIINSLRERDGKVIIDMFIHQEGDCQAGPTKRVKSVYDYLKPDPSYRIFPKHRAVNVLQSRRRFFG